MLRGLSVERWIRAESPLVVSNDSIQQLLSQVPRDPVEQADRFLLNLAHKSSEPGIFTALTSDRHQGLAFSHANEAFLAALDFLKYEGLIHYERRDKRPPNDYAFRLTLDGWRRVAEMRRRGEKRDSAFVAMAFGPEFSRLWELAVAPALESTGWRPIRADKAHHTQRIDDWILNQIKASRFLVADTSDRNPGACFEAGFALGLEREVIWLAEKDSLDKGLHFDIRQYNHLTWRKGAEQELREPLRERVISVMGNGPGGTSNATRSQHAQP